MIAGKADFYKLRHRYVVAVLLTVSLLSLNQGVIQFYLRAKQLDASTVNIAGRQRMFSQRLGLLADDVSKGGDAGEMLNVLDKMQRSNVSLQIGNADLGILKVEDEDAQSMLEILEIRLSIMEEEIDHLILAGNYQKQVFREQIELFLPMMNDVVSIIEMDAEHKLQRILMIEIALFLCSLVILVLEIRFFFKPIFNRTESLIEKNINSHEIMRKMAFEYAHELRAPVTNILAISQLMNEKGENTDLAALLNESASKLDKQIRDSITELNNLDDDLQDIVD